MGGGASPTTHQCIDETLCSMLAHGYHRIATHAHVAMIMLQLFLTWYVLHDVGKEESALFGIALLFPCSIINFK